MNIKLKYLLLTFIAFGYTTLIARENVGEKLVKPAEKTHKLMKFAAACDPATASADLDVNNVRTKILNGGDMWWDLSNPKYEIPKVAANVNTVRKHSLFSGAIWVGGYDQKGGTGNLKLAAMTYRQGGSDFWPGPLDNLGNTDETNCKKWDNIYKIKRQEIIEHYSNIQNGTPTLSENIGAWPGRTNINDQPMAPFFDLNSNGVYEPLGGDYPVLQNDCRGKKLNAYRDNKPEDQPDEMLYFVYNDKGNNHAESAAAPIGLELHTIAFAYASNDEINNMTFYTTRIVNRGAQSLYDTYFGEWVDADLGNYKDDYVGCDVGRSLGFAYNGDDNDEGILGYGLNPPSVGVDFFEGPKKDTTINGRDTIYELGMSKFVYYDNDFTNFGNPERPIHYYYYLTGRWKNGQCMTLDYKSGRTGTNCTNYLFPFDTDPKVTGNWNERSAGNAPADRRFLQTSGPFTLKAGAVNKLTVGVVWARASTGGAEGSLALLKLASDKAQTLFNNCFNPVDGPDAPKTEVQELDDELVFMFGDTKRIETFQDTVLDENNKPQVYKFEGYRIYQLKDGTVGTGDLEDVDKAREIFTCDLKNNIIRLVNKPFDASLGQRLPKLMIDAPNKGIVHSLSLTEDAFATGSNKSLVNFRTYYYIIMSYAAEPNSNQDQYLAGRFIERVVASPRNTEPRYRGAKVNGGYGVGPRIMRLEGSGNGGNIIDLTRESELSILNAPYKLNNPVYEVGKGPVKVTIVDPLKVPKGEFELVLLELKDSINFGTTRSAIMARERGVKPNATRWILIKKNDNGIPDTLFSENYINIHNEQLATLKATGFYKKNPIDWGMAVTIDQVLDPGNPETDETNGSLGCEVIFADKGKEWLTGMRDLDGVPYWNWIHSGTNGKGDTYKDPTEHDYAINGNAMDPFDSYEKLWEGRVGPYRLASRFTNNAGAKFNATQIQGVAFDNSPVNNAQWGLNQLSSVEFVITPDKSKWTRACVVEMSDDNILSEGSTKKFDLRNHTSLDINGKEIAGEKGRSWFPGYAINLETGERLNIVFGEDSRQYANNGRDMKWNPTSDGGFLGGVMNNGGRHYIYVMGSYQGLSSQFQPLLPIYDEGQAYYDILKANDDATRNNNINKVMYQCMYVIPAYLSSGYKMKEVDGMPVPDSEVRFKIRVKKPYRFYKTMDNSANYDNPRYSFNTNEVYTEKADELGTKALDLINIVPNPYYAYSDYENTSIENKVKLTNLPIRCDISIYTIDGTLVRRMKKDDESTDAIWDMKNDAKVPIASGVYLIHVNAPGLGEKVIKWMGVMRELDLDSF
ncbi:MAG: hypothetical protein ACKVQB_11770 [Bacteroidia bacterium]